MIDNTIARPYADAAFDYATAHNQVASWQDFLASLAAVFNASGVQAALNNPFVDQIKLADEIIKILSNGIDAGQANFLKLLASNHRLIYLNAIADLYQVRCEEVAGVMHVSVTSAFAMQEPTLKALTQKLAARYQKEVKVHTHVDPSLIGGMIIRTGDYVLDGSVKSMLVLMQQQMAV